MDALEAERIKAVVEYLAGERKPMTARAIAYGITDARGWGCDWPAGSVKEFEQAVDAAVKSGQLQEKDGQLWLATEPATGGQNKKPAAKKQDADSGQGMLF